MSPMRLLVTALLVVALGLLAGAVAGLVTFGDLGSGLGFLADAGSTVASWVRTTLERLLSG